MITCFPDPHPDEIFYSVCARYSDRMKYPSRRAVIRDLYGKRRVCPVVDLPTCFDALISNFPPGHKYSADKFIDDHTLCPFYGPFLQVEQFHRLREDMHRDNGKGLQYRIGNISSSVLLPNYFRFCPICVKEDEKCFGELYWHRIHQAPGVLICPIHRAFTQTSSVLARNVSSSGLFVSAQQGIVIAPSTFLDPSNLSHTILLEITCDIAWLLTQPHLELDSMSRHQRYSSTLKECGLLTEGGLVRRGELKRAFEDHYPFGLLSLLHCELGKNTEENWLDRLLGQGRSSVYNQHPLYHILLIHFLGYSMATFFHPPNKDDLPFVSNNLPFGEGPWPCLNATSDHYLQLTIKTCQISYDHERERKPKGMFSCECGFIYTRKGPDSAIKDRYRIGKIRVFGAIWERKLQALWKDNNLSLDQIADQLGVTRSTVKAHAHDLELPPRLSKVRRREFQLIRIPKRTSKDGKEESKQAKRNSYRKAWLLTQKGEDDLGKNYPRRERKKIFDWLKKNDKEWLEKHPRKIQQRQGFPRVDWQSRDKRIAEEVETEAMRLRNLPGRPIHISIRCISRNISRTALIPHHLDKLPLTSKILAEVAESYEQWSVRRIWWAADIARREPLRLSPSQLLYNARAKYYANVPCVKEALDAAMQSLEHGFSQTGGKMPIT
jgi:hypothetical protein